MKSEFGANHLCKLETSKSNWETEKERKKEEGAKKKKIDTDHKQFINVMSNVINFKNETSKNSSNPNVASRSVSTSRKRLFGTSPTDKERQGRAKKIKMEASTSRQGRNNEMIEDNELLSLIPVAGSQQLPTGEISENTTDGGGDGMAGLGRTNISNDLRSCVIDVNTNRGNNSSLDFLIRVLNLEDAISRRNILTKMKKQIVPRN